MDKPTQIPLDKIDRERLIGTCQACLDEEPVVDSDNPHYVYESAMEAIFWEDVFKYINSLD